MAARVRGLPPVPGVALWGSGLGAPYSKQRGFGSFWAVLCWGLEWDGKEISVVGRGGRGFSLCFSSLPHRNLSQPLLVPLLRWDVPRRSLDGGT